MDPISGRRQPADGRDACAGPTVTPPRHGLIIGKFYPPHAGHHELIRLAGDQCERVSVVVMASYAESIALADRVEWLRAEHAPEPNVHVVGIRCDAPLDLGDETVWAAQIAAMRAAIAPITDEAVDAVFSAETYGDELAARFDARHVRVSRTVDELRAEHVRQDLVSTWPRLAAPTRAGLTTRVVVVGAESTGTTTVSQRLAAEYVSRGGVWSDTTWVEEYGREFTEFKLNHGPAVNGGAVQPKVDDLVWTAADFDEVAAEQTRRENAAALRTSPLLVCDTDAFATSIWERRYLGAGARVGQPWAHAPRLPRRDLYLVTDHLGVPWQYDGLREGDLDIRAAMTGWFIEALTAAGHSWVLLTGTLEDRVRLALRTIDALLARRMTFTRPISGPGFGSASACDRAQARHLLC